ncbi:MAG TPA: hypothetical protein VFO55_03390, partial [Gemmatimonadaceae bacterium]|nr:hypothetical protein [Gemmatimonadaceae bacterium]
TGYDDIGPDAVHLEARVLLAVGDTAAAIASLDRMLDRLAFRTPGMLNKPVEMGGLMRAMGLRGDLAAAGGERTAARWSTAREILWSDADAALGTRR